MAFGDDAAAAGGLVVWDARGPCFCGDAIADPLSGMAATVAGLSALQLGGGWVVDVPMADVAAGCGRPARVDTGGSRAPSRPFPLPPAGPGSGRPPAPPAELGADTESVLAELGIR